MLDDSGFLPSSVGCFLGERGTQCLLTWFDEGAHQPSQTQPPPPDGGWPMTVLLILGWLGLEADGMPVTKQRGLTHLEETHMTVGY